ncbi:MAG: site-2 protease family protein [Candidatus Jorgensenbacteria bacterium]|nr:site-2 protease family protein [Candidatus Jorgensenbacteria bacterium]
MDMTFVFALVILLFSVVIHEVSHGYMAEHLGDDTARRAGRLTLNPIKHLDLVGSFLVPGFLALAGGVIFGWAKPVPFDPRNLKNPRRDEGLVALAGPASNFIIALVFIFLYRVVSASPLFLMVIQVNIALAIFNALPIPPLDGSKILYAVLPHSPRTDAWYAMFERQGFIFLLIIIFLGSRVIDFIIFFIYRILMGGMG